MCKALGIGNPSQMETRLDGGYLISSEISTKSKTKDELAAVGGIVFYYVLCIFIIKNLQESIFLCNFAAQSR